MWMDGFMISPPEWSGFLIFAFSQKAQLGDQVLAPKFPM